MTLNWAVHVSPAVDTNSTDIAPGTDRRSWSPITSTLIYGDHDAVLVDPAMTWAQGEAVADWVETFGRELTSVYVTHGHGDHWFGAAPVLARFPQARLLATPKVIAHASVQLSTKWLDGFWRARFPGEFLHDIALPEPLPTGDWELEGAALSVVDLGHTDTDDTTCLHVPDLGLIVAGDAAYNGVHLYLSESDEHGRDAWLSSLDIMEALAPTSVIAGHKDETLSDGPEIIEQTRRYIEDFNEALGSTDSAPALFDRMLTKQPGRINLGALWSSAQVAKR